MLEKAQMMRDVIGTQQEYAKARHLIDDVNLNRLIEDALKVEQSSLHKWGVQLNKAFAQLPPCRVHKAKLLQVVTNLIKNAREATEHNDALNKPKIVTLETGVHDARHAYLAVIDNGAGIAPGHLARIFQHGFTTKHTGHGFGLHASINAMREMQGDLRAESAGENCGARFTLIVPLTEERHEQ